MKKVKCNCEETVERKKRIARKKCHNERIIRKEITVKSMYVIEVNSISLGIELINH
jgi:hypothetical protein